MRDPKTGPAGDAKEIQHELANCPFCGGGEVFTKAWSNENGGEFAVAGCSACGAKTQEYWPTERTAAAAWNRRAPPEPAKSEIVTDDACELVFSPEAKRRALNLVTPDLGPALEVEEMDALRRRHRAKPPEVRK